MRYKYDAKTDTLVLTLGRGRFDFGEQKGNVITHYDKKGKPLEIEILDASRTTLNIVGAVFGAKKRVAVARA